MTTTEDSVIWRDPERSADERVTDLIARMSLEEKIAQLYGIWVGMDSSGEGVAPHQHDNAVPVDWDALIPSGLGQLTRPFGTRPVDPHNGATTLARSQREIVGAGRFGIPAMVHEECLTGLTAWQATIYPAPLAWGASFDPDLVQRMAAKIGESMRSLGVHQGLAPLLDVTRDLRWGRVEETVGEDPHLVGLIGSAYVRGLESSGIVATLKHFVGYSASRGGRNLAPVSIGRRELTDILLPPFEMALRAGARSVMNSYNDLDGVPTAADAWLLTDVLRDQLGFTGTVVADYFSVSFLQTLHGVAADSADAARLALSAGVDVELPTVNCYGSPLIDAVAGGRIDVAVVDRAVARVLRQKADLGLLDPDWNPDPLVVQTGSADLNDDESRYLALRLAEESVVLLANNGILPLARESRLAVVGPNADQASAMLGCYTFPMHVAPQFPDTPLGVEVPTLLDAIRAQGFTPSHAAGCTVLGGTDEELAAAVELAKGSDVCVAVLGDFAGLFGRGTSGEGCDVADLRLPGRQEELLEALIATGTPVIAVLLVGRSYELTRQIDRLAAVVCGFFPGQDGGAAVAGVLAGTINPSGRLPISFPGAGAGQPSTYLASPLGTLSEVSNIDPTPLFGFGHGLSYTPVTWQEATLVSPSGDEWPTDGTVSVEVPVHNPHDRPTTEIVQLYLHDPVAETVRPVQQMVAAARVELAAGESRTARFTLHADLTSYTGMSGRRIVDQGEVELRVAASSQDIRQVLRLRMAGRRREVGADRVLLPDVEVH
jgi:beta-xylosidase